MTACCLYYTCHTHDPRIEAACRAQLDAARGDIPLVAVGLQPFEFGDTTLVLEGLERGPLTMHKQILAGLRFTGAEWVYLCESDVLYHPAHFAEVERREYAVHYNTNVWRVRWDDGHAVWTDDLQQVSGLCAPRDALLDQYARRVAEIERDGFDRHYEPGHKTGWAHGVVNWQSECPNVDIRHDHTLTRSKWSPGEFRNRRYAKGWRETDDLAGWGNLAELMDRIRGGRYAPIGVGQRP